MSSPSQLTLTETDAAVAAFLGIRARQTQPTQPRMTLGSVAEQVRALVLAQRSLADRGGDSAWAAEDDHRRFANRSR